jgi:leucine-rich repeat protein SHOC2
MGGLNSKQIADIKKGKTDVLVITNQRKETLQKKFYTLTSTRAWNLSNNFLTSISSKIAALTLTSIDLSSNDFLIFPAEICKIPTLTALNLSYNFITDIPADVQYLTSLAELNLSFNRITDINELGKVTNLQVLKITNNYISKIPDSFLKLQHLNLLSVSHNNISSLPKHTWLALESFHISFNVLTHVPFSFLCQPKLRVISLARNKIQTFPSPQPIPAGLTSNLKEIFINNNHLTELHTNIYHFPKLEVLDVKANELLEIPFELFVHSPLIRTLDLSFNPGCKWGMHMPNTFAPPPLIRDIHLSKR